MAITIIERDDWRARSPRSTTRISTPTPELWLHHSAGSEERAAGVRKIQNFHMDGRGWSDIAYSFIVDRNTLEIFAGRGAGVRGGHTFGHNGVSHGICVMGNFETIHTPTERLIQRLADLVRWGHGRGWWPPKFTGGHRDVRPTSCPGNRLYTKISTINAIAINQENPNMPPDRGALIGEAQTKLTNLDADGNPQGPRFYIGKVDQDFGPLSLDGVHKAVNLANEADEFRSERDDARAQLLIANGSVTELQEQITQLEDDLRDALRDPDPNLVARAAIGDLAVQLHNAASLSLEPGGQ